MPNSPGADVPTSPSAVVVTALTDPTVRVEFTASDETVVQYVALLTRSGTATPVEVPLAIKAVDATRVFALINPDPPELPNGMYTVQVRSIAGNPLSARVGVFQRVLFYLPFLATRQVAAYNANKDRSEPSAASSEFQLGSTAPSEPTSIIPSSPAGNEAWVSFVEPTNTGGAPITRQGHMHSTAGTGVMRSC